MFEGGKPKPFEPSGWDQEDGFLDDTGTYWGTFGADVMHAALTSDTALRGWMGNDTIYGYNGDDRLHGCVGNDQLFGGNGDDLLVGCFGQDLLSGGNGDDILFGDRNHPGTPITFLGQDILTGGTGSDTFVLASSFRLNPAFQQNMLTGKVWDTITDLNLNTDKVALSFTIDDVLPEANSTADTLDGAIAELFAEGGALAGSTNDAIILNHDGEQWLIATGANAEGVFGKDDVLAKVTGAVGHLTVDDFVVADLPAYVIGNEAQALDYFFM